MSDDSSEAFTARMWAIVNCEMGDCSFDEAIVVMMPSKDRADAELARRRALWFEDDDWVDDKHVVLPIHINGVAWNSLEPVPEWWPDMSLHCDEACEP